MARFRLGTRGSALALWQANWVAQQLKERIPDTDFELVRIRTRGDLDQSTPLAQSSERGVFVKALESALLAGEIDAAVHSMKDLPSNIPEGLEIAAVCRREVPYDVLVLKQARSLEELALGAVLATGSPRRRAQLAHYRSDLKFVDIRGNLDSRLRKLDTSDWAGLVVAYAGLVRLGRGDRISEILPPEICLPAVGQGAIGLEVRANDTTAIRYAREVDHMRSHLAVRSERAFLRAIGGGCGVPVAAYGKVKENQIALAGMIAAPDGSLLIRATVEGKTDNPELVGQQLAELLRARGGDQALAVGRA